MKLAETHEKVKTEGLEEILEFELSNDSMLVDIMVRKIYSDPIAAFIRELSTNAVDSHVEANNLEPFDVHLPTSLDSNFWIRDYGTGLSKEKARTLYRTIGGSDKRDSNDGIGCFGLGSKTPLAYADNFMVESYHEGTKYVYNVHMKENGKIALGVVIDGVDTEEPNGLKIIVGAKRGDTASFRSKAEEIYAYFAKVKPNVVNSQAAGYRQKKIEYVEDFEYDDWGLRNVTDRYYQYNGCNAIMGGIAYKVDIHSLPSGQDEQVRNILSQPIDMVFKIGELAVEGGREKLHFNAATTAALVRKCKKIAKDIQKQAAYLLKSCKNYWEAAAYVSSLRTSLDHRTYQLVLPNLTYKGKPVKTHSLDVPKDCLVYEYSAYSSARANKYKCWHISPNKNVEIYIDDLPKGNISRCAFRARENLGKKVFLCVFEGDKKKRKAFVDAMGFDDSFIKNASDLPKPTRATSTSKGSGRESTKILKYKGSRSAISYCWGDIEKDLDDGGYYVVTNRFKIVTDELGYKDKIHPGKLNIISQALATVGKKVPEVYGVRADAIKKVKKHKKWNCYLTYVKEQVESFLKNFDVEKIWKARQDQNNYPKLGNLHYKDLKSVAKHLDKKNPIGKLLVEYEELSKLAKDFKKIDNIVPAYPILFNKEFTKPKVKNDTIAEKLYAYGDTYPLLSKIDKWATLSPKDHKHVAEYINCLS